MNALLRRVKPMVSPKNQNKKPESTWKIKDSWAEFVEAHELMDQLDVDAFIYEQEARQTALSEMREVN